MTIIVLKRVRQRPAGLRVMCRESGSTLGRGLRAPPRPEAIVTSDMRIPRCDATSTLPDSSRAPLPTATWSSPDRDCFVAGIVARGHPGRRRGHRRRGGGDRPRHEAPSRGVLADHGMGTWRTWCGSTSTCWISTKFTSMDRSYGRYLDPERDARPHHDAVGQALRRQPGGDYMHGAAALTPLFGGPGGMAQASHVEPTRTIRRTSACLVRGSRGSVWDTTGTPGTEP